MITRPQQPLPFRHWWAEHVLANVDHRTVVDQVRSDAGWSSHFAFMTLMSAGIAILGLLLSSPAVVIGAMLISPLMGPIVGLGFAVATFDSAEIRRTAIPLVAGSVLAVLFCALVVLFSPLQTVTSEIASRTRPNLFDLLVALFAGLAGTYAVIRGRHGTIVGVAIATALMPPLAAMGFGLATTNWPVLGGSTLLFFTNLMTIAAAAAVLARLYGFAPNLSPHQTGLQVALITVILIALAIPLALSLHRIAWEALAGRQVSDVIAAEFPKEARVGEFQIDFHAKPVEVTATVLTPEYRESAERDLQAKLAALLAQRVNLSLDQIRMADGADQSVQATAGGSISQRSASKMAERVAIVAGVPVQNVLVDAQSKRVVVRAAPLAGADLSTYRELENRLAAADAGWSVSLVPPPMPLPQVKLVDGKPDAEALGTAIWAARRLAIPVAVSGGPAAKDVATSLTNAGVKVTEEANGGRKDAVRLKWLVPGESPAAP
ncbi:putative hydrophobic protein (TIGR00271 family) [Sphingomonas sp. F9_3S_D5_B_2]